MRSQYLLNWSRNSHLSWNLKTQLHFQKSSPMHPILSHINPVHTLISYPISLRFISILSSHPCLGLPSVHVREIRTEPCETKQWTLWFMRKFGRTGEIKKNPNVQPQTLWNSPVGMSIHRQDSTINIYVYTVILYTSLALMFIYCRCKSNHAACKHNY